MNRFFSKLDLRDIKIDPQGSRFPPEEEAYADVDDDVVPLISDLRNGSAATYSQPITTELVERPGIVVPFPDVAAEIQQSEPDIRRHGDVLKVSARSRPSAVAGAIAGVVRESGRAEVQAIGAGATNQAVKAVAIAREYLRETGIEAVCLPAFIDVTIDNEDRTAIRLVIEPR
jgi:stage V sporulation protein S